MNKLVEIATDLKTRQFESTGSLYHPIPFDEFDEVTTSSDRKSAHKKWTIINDALSPVIEFKGARVLDVGANAGFYTFNMAKAGAQVEAFEPHRHYAELGEEITRATGLDVHWHNKKIEPTDLDGEYDVALMLSVFQWMSEGNAKLNQATDMLHRISLASRFLVFELGCNHGKSAIQVDGNQLSWLYRFLRKTTKPKKVTWVGSTSAWRGSKRHVFICSEEDVHANFRQRLLTNFLEKISFAD